MTTVYVYVMDTMADWETSHVMAELKSGRFFKKDAKAVELMTVSVSGLYLLPAGRVLTDLTIDVHNRGRQQS